MSQQPPSVRDCRARRALVLGLMLATTTVLIWRCVDLQVERKDFLQREGEARHLRTVSVPAHRGKIVDRNGVPLAISTPVHSVWVNPKELDREAGEWSVLLHALGLHPRRVARALDARKDREFVYLRRHITPDVAARVRAVAVDGVYLQREYRRYYPAAELTSHVVGFTNVDDRGQEGVELAFEPTLAGVNGREQVLRDRKGRDVEAVRSLQAARAGEDLYLSLDRRVQYFAYRALVNVMKRHRARAASAVVLDARSGEVLALVNQPSYNPNKRTDRASAAFRNRAVTDVFEPGSTIKPFTVAAALESGRATVDTRIDTSPGFLRVAGHTVRDMRDLGLIDLETLVKKSSNVGATKLALDVEPTELWRVFSDVGFGQAVGSGFPGEAEGVLQHFFEWRAIHRVTLSFGYGLSVSTLQLARAYAAIANGGRLPAVTLLRRDGPNAGVQVLSPEVARQLRRMLEAVTGPGGTGEQARVFGYRVGGKTGTVRKPERGGYADDRYIALFAGIAPMSAPRLSIAVMVDEPAGKVYYGGQVAAPVFAEIAAGSLRVLGVAPDDPQAPGFGAARARLAQAGQAAEGAVR